MSDVPSRRHSCDYRELEEREEAGFIYMLHRGTRARASTQEGPRGRAELLWSL